MSVQDIVQLIVSIVSGVAVCIPLMYKTIMFSQEIIKEKKWSKVVGAAISYMECAEDMFEKGADKKEWVMTNVKLTADNVGFNYDAESEKKISDMIDSICDASKILNNKEN